MICLYCSHKKTQVTNSRGHKSKPFVWRRRYCPNCQQAFTTHENVAFEQLPLVYDPNTSTKTPLDAFRLALTVFPILDTSHAPNTAYELSKTVIEHIMANHKHTGQLIPVDIASQAYEVLSRFDKRAAMQYGLKYGVINVS